MRNIGIRRVLRRLFAVPESKPAALPVDGLPGDDRYTWDDWHREMRGRYPVRHFMSEQLPIYLGRTKRVLWKEPVYFLVSHLHPGRRYHMLDLRSPRNGYRYGWRDRSDALLYASFAVLRDFVENEYPGAIDWNSGEDIRRARDEFLALHRWWTEERPRDHAELSQGETPGKTLTQRLRRAVLDDILRPVGGLGAKGAWATPESERRAHEWHERSEALTRKDDEMMKRLVDVRHFLWT